MLHIFSLRDNKAGNFTNPFFAAHAAIALRMISDVASDPQTMLAKHPDDFAIYRIGSFEPDTGVIHPEIVPVFIQEIEALLRRTEKNDNSK